MRPIFDSTNRSALFAALLILAVLLMVGCGGEAPSTTDEQMTATTDEQAAPDTVSEASGEMPEAAMGEAKELPIRRIPNIPLNAEAYYAPNNTYVIAQTQDPDAQKAEGRSSGALTYTFTDTGEDIQRINDRGQDACSYFMPDGKRLVYTSTRDNMDMPIGNWSDSKDYPQGAQSCISPISTARTSSG